MKSILVILTIIISGALTQVFTLDTAATKYYPVAVGNVWTYGHFATNGPSYRYQEKITGTIITNGHLYYIFTYNRIGFPQSVSFKRIDSLRNNILIYSANSGCSWLYNEVTGDSLSARKGDSSLVGCSSFYRADTITKSLFGIPRKTKKFSFTYFEGGLTRELTREFGFTYEYSSGHTNQSYDYLIGCVIDGTLYGDTSMLVGVNQINFEVPEKFQLSQNYPNPFNPITKINFAISGTSVAQTFLSVYDALGREVTSLVNQRLNPGTYEVSWDASAYPSGVYYYKLESGSFTETKKMVLLK
ncbi:MAG: T9SS type A sorting domain-containing protein [Ignavibacteria bacterium]|nr:T9SS type A sorting domain-containing protein [Ignavibacteria bacterium]